MNRQQRRHPTWNGRTDPAEDQVVGKVAFTVVGNAEGLPGVQICWDLPREFTEYVMVACVESAAKFGGLDIGEHVPEDAPTVEWVEGPHRGRP